MPGNPLDKRQLAACDDRAGGVSHSGEPSGSATVSGYFDRGETIRLDPSEDLNTLTGASTDRNFGAVDPVIFRRD
jgi:hypothetical protein